MMKMQVRRNSEPEIQKNVGWMFSRENPFFPLVPILPVLATGMLMMNAYFSLQTYRKLQASSLA